MSFHEIKIFFSVNAKRKMIVIISSILLLFCIFYIVRQSRTQNCLAHVTVNLTVGSTLLNDFSILGNTNTETFNRESKNLLGSFFNLNGNYRLLVKADKPAVTMFNGVMEFKNLFQVGSFILSNRNLDESLYNPLFEALNADIEFHKSEKMRLFGLNGDMSQFEVLRGSSNFLTVINGGIFEISNRVNKSQNGYMQVLSNIISSNEKPIVDINVPYTFIGRSEPIISALNPDFRISGYNTNGEKIASPIYEGVFMRPLDFNFVAFYPGMDAEMSIKATDNQNIIMFSMDALNSSFDIISDNNCKLSIRRCEGIINIMDTVFPLITRSDLSNVDFYFESVNKIDVRFRTVDENNISMIIDIDGITNKVVLNGNTLGIYTFGNIYKLLTSNYFITTVFTASVLGFFSSLFTVIFSDRRKKQKKAKKGDQKYEKEH